VVLYLATPSSPEAREAMSAGVLGCMTTPAQGNRIPDGAKWAADNGRFGCDGKGRNWPGYDRWWAWLVRQVDTYDGENRCLWALAPDVPFDAAATLAESRVWLPRIRALGIPAAFAAQDGCDQLGLPWDDFDVLFLAGDTAWKVGPVAEALTAEAKRRGKQVHMGRVNSADRLRLAAEFGCDSADGTYLVFGPDINLGRLLGWLDGIAAGWQPALFPRLAKELTCTP